MKFWPLKPYYKRSDWTTWLSERFSKAVTSKLWNKTVYVAEAYRNGAKLNYVLPLWFYQKSLTDLSKGEPREIHGKKKSR